MSIGLPPVSTAIQPAAVEVITPLLCGFAPDYVLMRAERSIIAGGMAVSFTLWLDARKAPQIVEMIYRRLDECGFKIARRLLDYTFENQRPHAGAASATLEIEFTAPVRPASTPEALDDPTPEVLNA